MSSVKRSLLGQIHSKHIVTILLASLVIGMVVSIWLNTVFYSEYGEIAQKDYTSYLTGAQMVRGGAGHLLYNINSQIHYQTQLRNLPNINLQPLPFKTPPVVSLIFLPYTQLSLRAGYIIYSFVNISILVFIILFLNRKILKKQSSIFLYLLPFLFFPGISLIIRGQISLYLFLVIIGVYMSLIKKLSFRAGFVSGLILIKPQYLLLIPLFFLLVTDKKRYISGHLLSTAILICANYIISGADALISYPSFLLATEIPFFGSHPEHIFSIYPLVKGALLNLSLPVNLAFPANFVLYAAFLYLFWKQSRFLGRKMLFIISVVGVVPFAVHTVDHDLIILLLPIYLLLDRIKKDYKNKLKVKKQYAIFLATALFLAPYLYIFDQGPLSSVILLTLSLYFLLSQKPYETN